MMDINFNGEKIINQFSKEYLSNKYETFNKYIQEFNEEYPEIANYNPKLIDCIKVEGFSKDTLEEIFGDITFRDIIGESICNEG